MLMCELQEKNVVNVCTARCLGRVMDLEFDGNSGRICTLIVPSPGPLCGLFFHKYEYWIPWKCVKCMGEDLILVEVDEEEIRRTP